MKLRIGLTGAALALSTALSASSAFAQTPPPEQTPRPGDLVTVEISEAHEYDLVGGIV